jgi:cell wall-associated NlpC family hydrolase
LKTRILFPRLLTACALTLLSTVAVVAQSSESEVRPVGTSTNPSGTTQLETFPLAPRPEEKRSRLVRPTLAPLAPNGTTARLLLTSRLDKLLLTAIESHLGATYYYTGTGPDSFDCSGFVWRTYQEAGIDFTRGPARSYWATFAAPPKEEQFKFGTLVFFSGLAHVGIVADEKGFYHSSRHHGVIYSPFNDYWLSRIDGFRRVPTAPPPVTAAKSPRGKTVSNPATVEER